MTVYLSYEITFGVSMKRHTLKTLLLSLILSSFTVLAGNPLNFGSNIKTADPSGHVWQDGKMYLYTSHDEECQPDFYMKNWHTFSSDDLVNWVDHGPSLSVDDLTWADNYAWAPDAAYKNGKYYLVFPAGTGVKDRKTQKKSTKWMGIGVAVSDSPTGPFKDAIGAPLWTEPYANDPSIFIDDDDKAYLYFHGKGFDYYVAELADDLLSVKGNFIKMDMGGYEPKMEGPWIFKRNGLYYFTMPENNRKLAYYTSKSPTGLGNTTVFLWPLKEVIITIQLLNIKGIGFCFIIAGLKTQMIAISHKDKRLQNISILTTMALFKTLKEQQKV